MFEHCTQSPRNLPDMLTLCALSHKDGGITEALRTSSYPYASSFAKLGLLRCRGVNKTRGVNNWSNVRKKFLLFHFHFLSLISKLLNKTE